MISLAAYVIIRAAAVVVLHHPAIPTSSCALTAATEKKVPEQLQGSAFNSPQTTSAQNFFTASLQLKNDLYEQLDDMASELEGLIAGLLVHISCAGEQGCPVGDVLDAIHHPSRSQDDPLPPMPQGDPAILHRTASTIWGWLVARRDISVGPNRKYNHLTLDETLALSPPEATHGDDGDSQDSGLGARAAPHYVRVFASEETMWESLTGHAVDYKRVPKSEWLLLLGIASTTTQGILQGDLGRLVDQDKRSVPKRTDTLLKKGYIAKRTTLVRGTKTSKMWLKLFAPPLPKDAEGTDELRSDMTLTRQVLVDNLDPVPWHIKWTGESIDYTALATTIMAIAKEWGVLRMTDMKAKLGVLGMRWQMKVLAKVCRFLNARGVIQYVAAKLGEKVFKDCIKYVRDFNSEDWSVYLATGKRQTKPPRNPDLDGLDGNKQLLGHTSNVSEVSTAPPWSLDKPVPVIIAEMAQRLGDTGLTNPDVYALTLGPSYSRHLSSMTTALSVPNLQPPHLSHFQLRSEHTRSGKVASYRYFAQNISPSAPQTTDEGEASGQDPSGQPSVNADSYGFLPISTTTISTDPAATLTELCNLGLANRKPNKGRPRKLTQPKKQKATPTPKAKAGRKKRNEESPMPTQEATTQEEANPREDRATPHDTVVREENVPAEDAATQPETVRQEAETSKSETPPPESLDTEKLPVTVKVVPDASKDSPTNPEPDTSTPVRATRTRSSRSSTKKRQTEIASPASDVEEAAVEVQGGPEAEVPDKTPVAAKPRGRPRKPGARKRGKGAQAGEGDSGARPWVCDKCGNSWKNDIGLKYHLEKSRTSCNPSFDEFKAPPIRRARKRAASEIEDADVSTPAADESPQVRAPDRADSEKEDQQRDSENESFSTPARRVSKLRGPVAARPTWASRPTVSFKGDSFQVNPEWRRPPVTSFDTPKRPSLLNGTNGALVQTQDGPSRPVLGPLHRFSISANSPKTPRPSSQKKEPQSVIGTPQPEQRESGQDATNGQPKEQDVSAKPKTPSVANSPLPKAILNTRISEIVRDILAEQSGVFPGGKALWQAITIRWGEQFPGEPIPQVRAYQAALRDMLKIKTVAEHFHAARNSKGLMEKFHIVIQEGLGPFSPEATNLVEKMKEAHPDPYLPPPFDELADGELFKRGRRDLPEEVEMLDAPVYAAKAAQKRALEDVDQDGDYAAPPPKRGRRRKRAVREASTSPARQDDITWIPNGREDENAEQSWYDHFGSFSIQGPPESIQFLAPNTFLDEDDPPACLSRGYPKDAAGNHIVQEASVRLLSREMVFDKAILVSGNNGAWPYLSTQDFEFQDASYTLKGWMPDMNWFAWSSMLDLIDQRALALKRRKRQSRTDLGRYQRFVERLQCCIDTERAWAESFIHAPPGAAGPYNIFVPFSSGTDTEMVDVPALSWPPEWQLAPSSFPGAVPDRQLLIDSPSSDEDDGPEWPTLPVPSPEPSRPVRLSREHRQRETPQPRIKRVRLVTRALTSIAEGGQDTDGQSNQNTAKDSPEDADRLLAAFVAVRVLLGGSDKSTDWGLLLKLFPSMRIKELRRFWINARKEQGAYIGKLTKDFQDKFLIAYQKEELPEIDFDDPLDYDWDGLIDWTLQLPRRKGVELPSTRALLEENFSAHKAPRADDDWREKFYHPQSSVFSRFEAATAGPAVVTVDKMLSGLREHIELTDDVLAKSWIRSLCCTDESRYSVDQIKQKFSTLANGDQDQNNMLLKQAIDDLTRQRIICKSKRPPLGGRPYRLNEWYSYMMGKLAQRTKYQEAADLKAKLDTAFRRGETFKLPFNLDDGSVMALTNLNAAERIRLTPVDVPDIPLGFEPGNYESRKFPKSYYHFDIEAVPTETYKYDEDIDVLRKTIYEGPPSAGKNGVLPQWIDFFGRRDAQRWMDVLGAFCFVFATRGILTIEAICTALKPILEEFEAQMIFDWGKKTGVLKESEDGLGVMAGEWWWLAVPWQWGRQLKYRGRRDDD